MTAEQVGTLVAVAVSAQHQIDAAGLEDGQKILTHLDQLGFGVRVMRSLGVGGVMPERDDPGGGGAFEVELKPPGHGAVGRPVRRHGIQADEMDVGVVKRVVAFRARGDAAGFAGGRQGE